MYVSCQNEGKVYRYLFKDENILQIGELNIDRPTVVAIVPSKNWMANMIKKAKLIDWILSLKISIILLFSIEDMNSS